MCTASPDGWLIDYQSLIDGLYLRRGVKRCAHVHNLSWCLVDWLLRLIDGFYIWGGVWAVCPHVQPLLMVGWLISKVWVMDFIFGAGCDGCAHVFQPLLMVVWLITKVRFDWWILYLRRDVKRYAHVYILSWWLIDYILLFEAGYETVCPCVQRIWLFLENWNTDPLWVQNLNLRWFVDWFPRFNLWILYLRRGVKRCAHVYSLYCWLVDWLPWFDWWILYLRRGVKRSAHLYV